MARQNLVKYLQMIAALVEKDTVDEREEDPITKIWHAVSSGLVAKQIAEEQRQGKFLKGQEG